MLAVGEFFYGNFEPVWVVNTAASPVKYQKQMVYDYQFVPSKGSSSSQLHGSTPHGLQNGGNPLQTNYVSGTRISQQQGIQSQHYGISDKYFSDTTDGDQRNGNHQFQYQQQQSYGFDSPNRGDHSTYSSEAQRQSQYLSSNEQRNTNTGKNQKPRSLDIYNKENRKNRRSEVFVISDNQNQRSLQRNSPPRGDYSHDGGRSSLAGVYLQSAQFDRSDVFHNPRQQHSQSHQQQYSSQEEGSRPTIDPGSKQLQQGGYSRNGGGGGGNQQNKVSNDYGSKQTSYGESSNGSKDTAYHLESYNQRQNQSDQRNTGSRQNLTGHGLDQSYNFPQPQSHQFPRQEFPNKYVRLSVDMCCEGCEERVSGTLSNLIGVRSVQCNYRTKNVVVYGTAAPADILKACKRLHKKSCLWVEDVHGHQPYRS